MTARWTLAGLTALATAVIVGLMTFLLSPVAPLLSAVVFGICALPVGIGLGWIVCVAPVAAPQPAISDDDIESRWQKDALSGTATDLVVVIGLALTAVSITRADVSATVLLTALLFTAFASCTMRYAIQRRRALSA